MRDFDGCGFLHLPHTHTTMERDKLVNRAEKLSRYYDEIHESILLYQSHTLGLFPRGHSQHARVRDNVYCATALWSLSLAYRHIGYDRGRTYELEKSAVKCMRGLLHCFLRQAERVELFKQHRDERFSLHSRFDCHTGCAVTDDNTWGHLQIDGVSLYLLILAQMTASRVQVIFTKDEVDFVQNLVYYVERAYRTPDYGMWERGSRENIGHRELHASSVGMAKAALDAINGVNLFGEDGSQLSTIHVDPDAQYRNYVILDTLLPKESRSKETDAAILCITGYPAFTIDDEELRRRSEEKVVNTLEGKYGFKRFLKDGHHTVVEDRSRRYYQPMELEEFDGIECQWPLVFLYKYITEIFRNNHQTASVYWKKLKGCLVDTDADLPIVPKLYYYPQVREDNNNVMVPLSDSKPFLWAQALFFIARLLKDKLVSPVELDPIGLHLPAAATNMMGGKHLRFRPPGDDILVQVALISESFRLQSMLANYGIPTQTPKQIEPVTLSSPGEVLLNVYSHLGANKKLSLTGRPKRPIGAIGTSKVYKIFGKMTVFYPTDLNIADFYMSYDIKLFIDTVKSILRFLNSYWNLSGRPTVTILLQESLFKGGYFSDMIEFLALLKSGEVGGTRVRLDRLQALISTSCIENLEYMYEGDEDDHSPKPAVWSPRLRTRSSSLSLKLSPVGSTVSLSGADEVMNIEPLQLMFLATMEDIPEQDPVYIASDVVSYTTDHIKELLKQRPASFVCHLYLLQELTKREGKESMLDSFTIQESLDEVYHEAATSKHWMAVRLGSSLLNKVVDCLAPSLSSILVKDKEVSIGVFGYPEHIITEPLGPEEISSIVYRQCMPYEPIEAVLQQELLIYLADILTHPDFTGLFEGMLRLRLGWIIQAMKNELHRQGDLKSLYKLAPYEVKELLKNVLRSNDTSRSPLNKRQLDGALNRVPPDFYTRVHGVLRRTPGGIQVRGRHLEQKPTIQIMSAQEKTFYSKVEELLSNVTSPEYRQLLVELLMVVSTVLERNPELNSPKCMDLDDLLQTAFKQLKEDVGHGRLHLDSIDGAIQDEELFYSLTTSGTYGSVSYMAKAVVNQLLVGGIHSNPSDNCSIS